METSSLRMIVTPGENYLLAGQAPVCHSDTVVFMTEGNCEGHFAE